MSYRDHRTAPPFEPTRADRILALVCVLIVVGLFAYAVLDGTGAV